MTDGSMEEGDRLIDILAFFDAVSARDGVGLAAKTQAVDARRAEPGEVIETYIAGEGLETRSAPARPGDMVVRNRCEATGNEEFLLSRDVFARKYSGPTGTSVQEGWQEYRPVSGPVRFVYVPATQAAFSFLAPWGEPMIARPGDIIAQDPADPGDTYRIARKAFDCTYEVLDPAG